jgi:hypothetical protein
VSHGNGNDKFRGQDAWPYGADPRIEVPPDQIGAKDRERLEKALCDAPELDVGMISTDLATDPIAIGVCIPGLSQKSKIFNIYFNLIFENLNEGFILNRAAESQHLIAVF